MTPAREQEIALALNRITYRLANGWREEDLTAEMIGAGLRPDELEDAIVTAKARKLRFEAEYRGYRRKEGSAFVAGGILVLLFLYYLSQGPMSPFQQGRLMVGWALGGGALLYGLWRFVNPDYRD